MARLVRRSLGEGGSAASYGAAVLHAPQVRIIYSPFQTWHGVAHRAQTAEAVSFHSAMKHSSAFTPQYEAFASLIR